METVIAMALLGLILAGSFALLVSSYSTMRRTQESLYVNKMMESALEMTRNLSFQDLKTQAASSPIRFATDSALVPLYGKVNDTVDDAGYKMHLDQGSGTVTIQKIHDLLYRVTVDVSWKPYARPARTLTVATYVSNNGINRR